MKYTISSTHPIFNNADKETKDKCDGRIFNSVKEAVHYLCDMDVLMCKECPMSIRNNKSSLGCSVFIESQSEETIGEMFINMLGLIPIADRKKSTIYTIKGKKIKLIPIN